MAQKLKISIHEAFADLDKGTEENKMTDLIISIHEAFADLDPALKNVRPLLQISIHEAFADLDLGGTRLSTIH